MNTFISAWQWSLITLKLRARNDVFLQTATFSFVCGVRMCRRLSYLSIRSFFDASYQKQNTIRASLSKSIISQQKNGERERSSLTTAIRCFNCARSSLRRFDSMWQARVVAHVRAEKHLNLKTSKESSMSKCCQKVGLISARSTCSLKRRRKPSDDITSPFLQTEQNFWNVNWALDL